MTEIKTANFSIGQIVDHRILHFRGVIVDIDFYFLSCINKQLHTFNHTPEQSQLWYHLLIDNTAYRIYVPETDLYASDNASAIIHPVLDSYFSQFRNGTYQAKLLKN